MKRVFKIALLFRKTQEQRHSIEVVFKTIMPFFAQDFFEVLYLPYNNKGYCNKLMNILWTRRIKSPIHVTGDSYYAVLLSNRRILATIHDVGILNHLKGLKRWLVKYLWFRNIASRSSYLIFVSEFTKREFFSTITQNVRRAEVIHNPLRPTFKFRTKTFDSSCPTILHIGTKSNKNLTNLAEALQGIKCKLVVVGVLTVGQTKELSVKKIDFLIRGNLRDEELLAEYESCDLLAFVSTYEGFGLPIIEAQAVGRPVLTSNISSMPEIAGEGACFVDPYDPSSIRQGLMKIISDSDYRESLISRGRENVRRFDAKEIASQYEKVYREVLESEPS